MSSSTASHSGANILGVKDANLPVPPPAAPNDKDASIKCLEYHRQVLQSKMEDRKSGTNYVSPSDEIMSPCTAKLTALRNKHVSKVKPRSLFAQASSRTLRSSEEQCGSNPDASAPSNA